MNVGVFSGYTKVSYAFPQFFFLYCVNIFVLFLFAIRNCISFK